jgi:hypothetical protein
MAAVVDYGVTDMGRGRYGLYNDFFIRITHTGGTVYKLKYRIRIAVGSVVIEKDVNPINQVSVVNPVESLKDTYFRTQLVGTNGVSVVPLDSGGGGVADRSYQKVVIQVGEVFSLSESTPATFQGYNDQKTIPFYNGFEEDINQSVYSNWRPANMYNTAPYKLPLVNKNNYLLSTDIFFVSLPSELVLPVDEETPGNGGNCNLSKLYYQDFDINGNNIGTLNSFGLLLRYGANFGYWTIAIGREQVYYPSNFYKRTYYAAWVDSNNNEYKSESFDVIKAECDPKYDRFRLRWFNKYSGFEYFNFTKKSKYKLNVKSGKEIISNGVDYTSTNFSGIKYPAVPESREVGKSATTTYTLNSDWINEEEQKALKDLYISPNVIMFDKDNKIIPVIVQDKSYEVTDIKEGLVKVSINVMVANNNKVIKQ